jgi:undecaprenyl-diphosphatase
MGGGLAYAWDIALFRWINRDLASPFLDPVMRFLSGNALSGSALAALAAGLLWRSGRKGLVFVVLLGVAAALANELVAEPLKDWSRRPRPYAALNEVILRVGRGNPLGGMPSAHAMNAVLMATFATWFYRPAGWVVMPLAAGVGFSRVYNGAHSHRRAGRAQPEPRSAFCSRGGRTSWRWSRRSGAGGWPGDLPPSTHRLVPSRVGGRRRLNEPGPFRARLRPLITRSGGHARLRAGVPVGALEKNVEATDERAPAADVSPRPRR